MRDEEYIEMKIKEDRKKIGEDYKLKLSDFIPIVGVINHLERYSKQVEEKPEMENSCYKKYLTRGIALTAYNFAFLTGAAGLLKLLN